MKVLTSLRESKLIGPGHFGWVGVVAVTVAADVRAIRTGQPTMSALVARAQRHPVHGPIVVGVAAGLVYHLLVEPLLRAPTTPALADA